MRCLFNARRVLDDIVADDNSAYGLVANRRGIDGTLNNVEVPPFFSVDISKNDVHGVRQFQGNYMTGPAFRGPLVV